MFSTWLPHVHVQHSYHRFMCKTTLMYVIFLPSVDAAAVRLAQLVTPTALLTLEHSVYKSYLAIQVILTQGGRLSTSQDRAMLRVDNTIHVAPKKHDLFASTVPKRVEL